MNASILYVEDDIHNRLLVRRILEAQGYIFLEADTGQLGLTMITQDIPDIAMIDINLPDIDGYEIVSQIRQNADLAQLPLIAITGNVLQGDREKALAAGFDLYLAKPIDVDALPRHIAHILKSKVPTQASPSQTGNYPA